MTVSATFEVFCICIGAKKELNCMISEQITSFVYL
jgi:hypothetical protein